MPQGYQWWTTNPMGENNGLKEQIGSPAHTQYVQKTNWGQKLQKPKPQSPLPGGSPIYQQNPYTAAPEYMQLQRAQAMQRNPPKSRTFVPKVQALNIQGFRPTGNTNPYLQMASLMNTSRGQ